MDKFLNWYLQPWKKYAEFTGRAGRMEYWLFTLVNIVVMNVFLHVHLGIVSGIFAIASIIPGIAVAIRRLHDTNRSGWWILIALIPIIGAIILIVFTLLPGEEADNQYGSPPQPPEGAA